MSREAPTYTSSYSPKEERINVISHAIGFGLSVLGFVSLLWRASLHGSALHILSFGIFGLSMILLYAASTLYHVTKDPKRRKALKVFDHAAIYGLIAGTYTPFALITLQGTLGYLIFALIWALALTGITLKLFFTGRFTRLSTMMYLLMGWIVILAIKPLIHSISIDGFLWLLTGGIAYSLGAVLYLFKSLSYSHAAFHLFVLVGSGCHFVAVIWCILPRV
jgi:hemolysin III